MRHAIKEDPDAVQEELQLTLDRCHLVLAGTPYLLIVERGAPLSMEGGGKGLPCRGEKRAFQPAASVAEKEVELLSGLHLEAGRLAVGHQPYRR